MTSRTGTSRFGQFGRMLMAGVTGLLVGCSEGPASNVSYKHSDQVWNFFIFAVKDGPVLVEIDGNPFADPADVLATTITAAMRRAFTEPFVAFTVDRTAAAHPQYRIIWTLNPAPGYDMNAVCRQRLAADTKPRDRLEMRVAFCQDGRLLAAVHGWMRSRDAGPESERWRSLVTQMSIQLVSAEGF